MAKQEEEEFDRNWKQKLKETEARIAETKKKDDEREREWKRKIAEEERVRSDELQRLKDDVQVQSENLKILKC